MANPNNPGTGEGLEANINADPNNNENKYNKLLRSYISDKLNNKSDRLSFAKKIKSLSVLPEDILQDIEAYKSTKAEFTGVNVNSSTINLLTLQRELGGFLAGIQSKKVVLRSLFLQDYDISTSDYTKYLSAKVDAISTETQLLDLIDSDIQRDEFILGIYKKKVPKRRLVSHILKDMNLEERFERLEPHLKLAFIDTVSKFSKRQSLEIADIMALFETNLLTLTEKQKIIETFMPSISLADGIRLGVFDIQKANKLKQQAIKDSLDSTTFKGVNLASYTDTIDASELIISTQGLFSSGKSQEKLFEQNFFFQRFKKQFDATLKKIESDLASESIQTANEMQEILSGVSYISGIESFKEGSILILKKNQVNAAGKIEEVTLYAEIKSLASAGTFILQERGVGEYTRDDKTSSRFTYSQFIDYLTKGDVPTSVEFINKEVLDHRIRMGQIQDLNDRGRFEDRSELSTEIAQLTQKIEERKKELTNSKVPKSEWKDDEILKNLYTLQAEKEQLRNSVEGRNTQTLANQIDELDPAGKNFELKVGTSFVTKGGHGDIFSITSLEPIDQTLVVRGLNDDEPMSYKQFLHEFEKQKAVRVSKIDTFEELFSQSSDAYKSWQGFKLEEGKVRNKASKTKINYDYLVPDTTSKDQLLIKIHSIDSTMVTISFGEAKSKNSEDKKGKKTQQDVFSTETTKYTVSIGVLDHYVRQNKLSFRSLEEGKITEEEMKGIPKPKEKGKFFTWFFQGISIASAIKGSKTVIEQVTNMLNEGDAEKANQFALKVFGPLLGKDGKTDLMSRVEQTQKKSMEEFIQRLKDINSKPATQLIERWLIDPRTPEYKKEAAMFYMFEKYGALCAKEMYQYQGKYFWYQKMGGRIGDSNWVETHQKNNREPKQNTTEEQLVYNLMSEQVKEGGYNGVQRRSKLAKDLKALRGKGKTEEYDTGVKDGGNERSIQDRLDGGLSELSSGNYPNAFGWQETIENKGGSMKQMNMIPFVAMFSGMAYNFEKDVVDKVKNGAGDSRLLMMKSFISYSVDIDLVNQTIMAICRNLNTDPQYTGILGKAQNIFDKQKDRSKEKDKQDATIAFYKEYGEVLTNILYMLNTGNKEDIYNKMIFFEKDNKDNPDRVIFTKYYDKMDGISSSADTSFSHNEGLMADAFAKAGTSGINMYKATKELLELRNEGTWSKHDAGPLMWKEIVHEFESIPQRKYNQDPIKNEKMQRELLEYNVRMMWSAILATYTSSRAQSAVNSPTGYFTKMNEWGMYFDDIANAGANADSIKSGGNQELINKFVQNILDVEKQNKNFTRPTRTDGSGGYKYIDDTQATNVMSIGNLIQGKTQSIMKQPNTPANSNSSPQNLE